RGSIVALAALAAGSDVLIRSAGADSTRAPIGAPPPFFHWRQGIWEWRWQGSGAMRRETALVYPPLCEARGRMIGVAAILPPFARLMVRIVLAGDGQSGHYSRAISACDGNAADQAFRSMELP